MRVSGAIGATQAERDRIVDVALGALDPNCSRSPRPPRRRPPSRPEHRRHLLGTDVAAAARKRGFGGVTVVLTGSSRGDVARLGALPHVDVCAEKGADAELSARLRRALAAKGA